MRYTAPWQRSRISLRRLAAPCADWPRRLVSLLSDVLTVSRGRRGGVLLARERKGFLVHCVTVEVLVYTEPKYQHSSEGCPRTRVTKRENKWSPSICVVSPVFGLNGTCWKVRPTAVQRRVDSVTADRGWSHWFEIWMRVTLTKSDPSHSNRSDSITVRNGSKHRFHREQMPGSRCPGQGPVDTPSDDTADKTDTARGTSYALHAACEQAVAWDREIDRHINTCLVK